MGLKVLSEEKLCTLLGSEKHLKFVLDGIPILKMKSLPHLRGTDIGQKDAIFCLNNSRGCGSGFTLFDIL